MTRREFLKDLGALLRRSAPLAITLPWIGRLPISRGSDGRAPLLPPGARFLAHFAAACTACGRCVSVCPTRVLQPSLTATGLRGTLQPVLDLTVGYCEYPCVRCSEVCPTGAIGRISPAEKQRVQIGQVSLVRGDCIVIARGTACGACAEICPTQAVRMVPFSGRLMQPMIDPPSCVGCGACERVCPSLPRKAISVIPVDPHRTAVLPRPAAAPAPPEAGPPAPPPRGDFPF